MRPQICVVYLQRGQESTERFFDSYEKHPAGIKHSLLLFSKGWMNPGVPARAIGIPNLYEDFMLDIQRGLAVFGKAARNYAYDYFCCLNSYSKILADDWLLKLHKAASQPDVGIAGCTGSYESFNSRLFPKFPNPHIRTNAFMMRGSLMRRVWPRFIISKTHEHYVESGYGGITRKIRAMNLEAVVVDRDGNAFSENWDQSETFRMGHQRNLLIADNRTDDYELATAKRREQLELRAWGRLCNFTIQNLE